VVQSNYGKYKRYLIYIIPAVAFGWYLFLMNLAGPFYLTRIDPEYPYLLNGLNCARLDFHRIGHIDHPGTPFQMLTGLFIRLTYWMVGSGTIVEDVITRPEFYLSWSSFWLNTISFLTLLWLGKIIRRNDDHFLYVLILQCSIFMSCILIDIPQHYIPDRLLEILSLIFSGSIYRFQFDESYTDKKFAVHSGILMGIGLITKVNFLPLIIIPFLMLKTWRHKLQYTGIFILSAIVSISPVYNRLNDIKVFLSDLVNHDGLYGNGAQRILNMSNFWSNLHIIFRQNIPLILVLLAGLSSVIFSLFKSNLKVIAKKEISFITSILPAIALSFLMVAKHFKGYYIIPVVCLTGIMLLTITKILVKFYPLKFVKYISGSLVLLMFLHEVKILVPGYLTARQKIYDCKQTSSFIDKNIPATDYYFIEPTWYAGPTITNGLTYGLGYIAFRHYYYNEYERFYPNALTWQSKNRPMKYLNIIEADNESLMKSGKNFYVLSSPWRHADVLCNYLDSCGISYGIPFVKDTIFINQATSERIIRLKNISGWKEVSEIHFGFEYNQAGFLSSDDGQCTIPGFFEISEKKSCNGFHSLRLSNSISRSPEFGATAGDYFELNVKRYKNKDDIKGNLLLSVIDQYGTELKIAEGKLIGSISSDWELVRLGVSLNDLPEGSRLVYYYSYTGNQEEYIDDLSIKHFSKSLNSGN
jgi:hypothetical protein